MTPTVPIRVGTREVVVFGRIVRDREIVVLIIRVLEERIGTMEGGNMRKELMKGYLF
jgi:hypothetical protein